MPTKTNISPQQSQRKNQRFFSANPTASMQNAFFQPASKNIIQRTPISPTSENGRVIGDKEEKLDLKSNEFPIQRMKLRNQSGGDDHIRGNFAPWPSRTDPSGDKHYAYTDAGNPVTAWTAISYSTDNLRYWCHGHTLNTFNNWFYSVFSGGPMQQVVNDEYDRINESAVQKSDIAVWLPSYGHSCVFANVVANNGVIDRGATRMSTKNGTDSLALLSLNKVESIYNQNTNSSPAFFRHK